MGGEAGGVEEMEKERREREKGKRERERELIAGIDQVLFTQNTSPIPDEMLAHRLGMVPLISQKVMDGLRYTRVSLSPSIPSNTSFPFISFTSIRPPSPSVLVNSSHDGRLVLA